MKILCVEIKNQEFFESEFIRFAIANGWNGNDDLVRFEDELPNGTTNKANWMDSNVKMIDVFQASQGVVTEVMGSLISALHKEAQHLPGNTVVLRSQIPDGITYLLVSDIMDMVSSS